MRPILAAGIVGVVLGFVAILDRGVAGLFDLGYLFVTFVGVIAGVVGVYLLNRRRGTPRELTAFDDPESRYRSAVPGDDLDGRIEMVGIEPRFRTSRRQIRDRIRDAAVRSLVIHAGYDRAAAHEAVGEGTWTDDPVAASFLAGDGRYPPQMRFKAFFGRLDLSETGARRSIEAIAAVIES